MNKKLVIMVLFLLMSTPLILANETTENPLKNIDVRTFAKDNPWNGTIIVSPVWQTLIGGFFGLNLHNESTAISVTEAIVFFMVFIMFFVIIADILKMTPFFKMKILGISGEFIASLSITTVVSITGAFINLKSLFISGIAYTVTALNWEWVNNAIAHKTWGTYIVAGIIVILIVIIHEILSWGKPLIKKYSEVSRAEAKGRMLNTKIQNN